MKRLAYFECPTGIAGDMCLGALVDAGVPLSYLSEQLRSLNIEPEYRLRSEKVHRQGQVATKVHVDLPASAPSHSHHQASDHPHDHAAPTRHLPDIEPLIQQATMPRWVKTQSIQIFRQLATAEGAVHGLAPDQVHFHEVGAIDAIVDIVGTCLGLDWLKIDELYCSALPTGSGTVKAAHGELPIPVPAVLKLWQMRQVPVYANSLSGELVTPTGAAIATTLAKAFGAPPTMTLETIGLGAGTKALSMPNLLRLWLGQATDIDGEIAASQIASSTNQDTVTVLATQLDDLTPQAIAYTCERLWQTGALDVFTQAIGMKKNRSGILLTVICTPDNASQCETILFQETTTLGIRHTTQQRHILNREFQQITTQFGDVTLKIASYQRGKTSEIVNVQPEYEDCARLAKEYHQPWQTIHQAALMAWYSQSPHP